jgi:hypothetical protein
MQTPRVQITIRLIRVPPAIRLLMVVVVILALAAAAITWVVRDVNQDLHEFYRPGGTLEQIHKGMGDGPDARGDTGS